MIELFCLKDALDLYQTQYSQVDKLWSYFGTFTLAILGFTIGSEKAKKSMKEVAAIIIGYLFRQLQSSFAGATTTDRFCTYCN